MCPGDGTLAAWLRPSVLEQDCLGAKLCGLGQAIPPPLCFGFPICKMGIMKFLLRESRSFTRETFKVFMSIKRVNICKVLRIVLGTK